MARVGVSDLIPQAFYQAGIAASFYMHPCKFGEDKRKGPECHPRYEDYGQDKG
jgi:hypothetical protein